MNDYPQVSIETAGKELNRLHHEIESKMRSTVDDAIRAGEILNKIKGSVQHGEFLPWVRNNCTFSKTTAEKYMGLFTYQSKIPSRGNLQEAYRQLETIELQEKRSEEEKAADRVKTFLKTGKKPEGWRRGTDDKLADEEKARRLRIDKITEDVKREHEERKTTRPPPIDLDAFSNLLGETLAKSKKREDFKERIRVSHEGKADPFVDAIMDYLDGLEDDNRRVEACYNIIKVCKGIANQLQVKG